MVMLEKVANIAIKCDGKSMIDNYWNMKEMFIKTFDF